jgi:hypothetical protein
MKFLINGYWKDDKSEFSNYLLSSHNDIGNDDNIFYYGLNESKIQQAIKDNGDDMLEFVITSYTKLKS